jgi:hypothetical protein
MYTVRVEARMDILGEVVDRFNVDVDVYSTKEEAKKIAQVIAHKEKCHSYRVPVHFVAKSVSNWK